MLFKLSMNEVTWNCHQALMHSLSSNPSKIKLTITWIMLRQCSEWALLAFFISCQVRISCCEVQWVFWLYVVWFSLLSFTFILKGNFRSVISSAEFHTTWTFCFVPLALLPGPKPAGRLILLLKTLWLKVQFVSFLGGWDTTFSFSILPPLFKSKSLSYQ